MSTTYNCVHYDRDLMRSCIYGLAVGDALGVPYEFCERGTFECTGMADGGTLEAALWCFMNTSSYADCVLAAVNLGGDTDTTAAVAGAIAGVYYGFGAIPPKWVGQLRGKAVIDQCI